VGIVCDKSPYHSLTGLMHFVLASGSVNYGLFREKSSDYDGTLAK
jgi:hypothetical protein